MLLAIDVAPPFVLFGTGHLLALAIIVCASVALPIAVRRAGPGRLERSVATGLATAMVAHEVFKIWLRASLYDQPLVQVLPLHLCNVATFVVAWALVRHSYRAFEVAYFWGLAGTVQALLTPDLPEGFPSPLYLAFFLSHGLIIVGVSYAIGVLGFRPTLRSVARATAVTLAYMVLITPLNIALDTNYMYLRHKPDQPSLMDYFGPWPWYILTLIAAGIAAFLVCYAPFALLARLTPYHKPINP